MGRSQAPDYCVVGHVTCDVQADGTRRAGGTVTFAALAAARLGYQVGALTSAGLRQAGKVAMAPISADPAIAVVHRPSESTTTFQNVYTGNARQQVILDEAEPLMSQDLPENWRDARVMHLGPIAHEIPTRQASLILERATGLRGLTPQGWLRRWDDAGRVTPGSWPGLDDMLPLADVIILSPEDFGEQRALYERLAREARLLVVTMADRGALVYQGGRETAFPAFEAEVVDPTGAGDMFAVAFLLRLAETDDVAEAARYANCAAAFIIEGPGVSNLPTQERIEQRLAHGKMRSV